MGLKPELVPVLRKETPMIQVILSVVLVLVAVAVVFTLVWSIAFKRSCPCQVGIPTAVSH